MLPVTEFHNDRFWQLVAAIEAVPTTWPDQIEDHGERRSIGRLGKWCAVDRCKRALNRPIATLVHWLLGVAIAKYPSFSDTP